MATYLELRQLFKEDTLRKKVEVACIVAAESIRAEVDTLPNHTARMDWAAQVFANPRSIRDKMLMAVLASNSSATVEAITGASDAMVQTVVDNAVVVFARD